MSNQAEIQPGDSPSVTITGIVFADHDADGTNDNQEKGLSNICVSDGLTCVLTDVAGHYRLETGAGRSPFVFVVVPTGYESSTGFYQEIPADAAQFTADFGLSPSAKSRDPDFSFVQITDLHVRNESDAELLAADLEEIQPIEPAFVVATGDEINNGHGRSAGMYTHYKAAIEGYALPICNVVGNHDLPIEIYEDFLGPSYYAFDYGGRHLVVLDCMSDVDQQRDWLRHDLALQPEGIEILVFQHYPPEKDLLDFLSQHNTRAIFSGHWHSSKVSHYQDILCINTPPLRFGGFTLSPRGFKKVSFRSGELILEDHLGGCGQHLTVVSPTDGAVVPTGKVQIKANAYDVSSKVTTVEYRIEKEPWRNMTSVGTWAWEAVWTGNTPGAHTIQVRTKLESGVILNDDAAFEVVDDLFARPQPGSDWPMFQRDPARTGTTGDPVNPPLHLAWSTTIGGNAHISSPVVANGTVYIGLQDEEVKGNAGVCALDASTGDIKWKYETLSSVKNSVAVHENLVFAMTVDGEVHALDATTGAERWAYRLDNALKLRVYASPVVSDGVVYLGVATHFVALDARTGKEVWRATFIEMASMLGDEYMGCYSSPCIGEEKVYVGFNLATGLVALDKQTGHQLWNKMHLHNPLHATPALCNDMLYHPAYGELRAMKAETGDEVWTFPLPAENPYFIYWTVSSPTISGSKLFVGSLDGSVFALDAFSGKKLWHYQTGEAMASFGPCMRAESQLTSSPVLSGNTVYLGSADGRLYALDADSGKEMWRYDLGVPITSSAAISGNTVYVASYDGSIYAFTQTVIA